MRPLEISCGVKRIERDQIVEICLENKKNKGIKTFAFILYNYRDEELIKRLEEKNFVASLDTILGDYVTAFYINENPEFLMLKNEYSHKLKKDLESLEKDIFNSSEEGSKIIFFNETLENTVTFPIKNSTDLKKEIEWAVDIVKDDKILDENKIEEIEKNYKNKFKRIYGENSALLETLKLVGTGILKLLTKF